MKRFLVLAAAILVVGAGAVSAESYKAFLIWVDVSGKKIVVVKYPPGSKEKGYGDRVKALREGKQLTINVDEKVKVFTRKVPSSKELAENPEGLAGLKMSHRIDPQTSVTIPIVELVIDDDSKKATIIKHPYNLAIEKKKN